MASDFVYPKGGWRRALRYLGHRLTRLQDRPHAVAIGFAAGVFVSFSPFFGLHLFLAMLIAWVFGGNIVSSLIGTLVGNPLTTPIIALAAVTTGRGILGVDSKVSIPRMLREFGQAWVEIWRNFRAIFSSHDMAWGHLHWFFSEIFLPYAVGGLVTGLIAAIVAYYIALSVIRFYRALREKRLAARAKRMIKAEGSGDPGEGA